MVQRTPILRSWCETLLGNLEMVRIEWNIRKSKRSHRICHCCLLESSDRISKLHNGAYNDGTGRVDDSAVDRAACNGLREEGHGMERNGYGEYP